MMNLCLASTLSDITKTRNKLIFLSFTSITLHSDEQYNQLQIGHFLITKIFNEIGIGRIIKDKSDIYYGPVIKK